MVASVACACSGCTEELGYHECQMSVPVYDTAYLIKYKPFSPMQNARSNDPICQCHMSVDGIYYSTITEVGYVNGKTHRCGEQPYSCSHLHHRELFWRRDGFQFFNLPAEVRRIILELLLVKRKVALTSNTELMGRFPQWKHEQPAWGLLQAVNRQMQAEASETFYSARNTFFLPPLRIRDFSINPMGRQVPINIRHIKRLDCELSMNDFKMSHAETYEAVTEVHPFNAQQVPFANWSRDEIQQTIHQELVNNVNHLWGVVTSACLAQPALDLFRIDFTNCRCPVGCCRLATRFVFDLLLSNSPRRFELCGLSDEEKNTLRLRLEESVETLTSEVFFVDQAGCTCTVSSGTRASLPTALLMRFKEDVECSGSCEGVQLVLSKDRIPEAPSWWHTYVSYEQQSMSQNTDFGDQFSASGHLKR